jgi:hypothetical protein
LSQLKLPRNWSEVPLSQYQELVELRKEELDPTEMLIEQLALLADISPTDDVFEEMTLDELLEITQQMKWLAREPHSTEVTQIEGLRAKKLTNLTLGEFIDLEHWISVDYYANMHRMLAILYKKFSNDEWGNEVEEPYIYDLEERSKIFLQEGVTRVWYALSSYLEFKENFVKSYTDLFAETNSDEAETEAEQVLNAQEKLAQRKADAEEKARSRWSWESILWSLSEGDVTKYDALFQSKVILIFNILAMKKSLNL